MICDCISYGEAVSRGISEKYLDVALNRYRRGLATSWGNTKIDGKVYIFLDTIPASTRKKYGILTTAEQEEREVRNSEQLRAIYDDRIKRGIYRRLTNALDVGFKKYLSLYNDYGFAGDVRREKARFHALVRELLLVVGVEKTRWGVKAHALEVLDVLYRDGKLKKPIADTYSFSRLLTRARKGIEQVVLHGNMGNKHRQILTDFHEMLILNFAQDETILSAREITYQVNVICQNEGVKGLSQSTVEHFLCRKEIKTLIEESRYGEASFENHVMPYLPRLPEKYAGDLWVMDGTPTQFWCKDEKGKTRRLSFYVVIDAFSRKVVGYDISISEDRFNVINALKMAFTFHKHLPSEILHDNFSALKTDEIQTIFEKLEGMGILFRAARVGNAKDKTQVERFFGSIQTLIMKLFHDYMGEGVTSKRKEGRPSEYFWKKAARQANLSIDEMRYRLSEIVKMYNNLAENGEESPAAKYKASPKPHVVELGMEQIPFMFWCRKSVTIHRSMLTMTVRKQKYYYELPSNEWKQNLNGKKVDVFYDEKDLDIVHLFTHERDAYLCECRRFEQASASQVGRDAAADGVLLRHDAKNKSYRKYLENERQRMISAGLEQVGKAEITLPDPLSTAKYHVNDAESEAMHQFFMEQEGIDDGDMDLLRGQLPRKTLRADGYQEIDFETLDLGMEDTEVKVYKRKSSDED